MYEYEKYDWGTQADADTLRRYAEIASNPARMTRAKSCIKDTIESSKKALSGGSACRSKNRATVGTLKVKF